jgi:hypothetical protein
LYPNPVQSTLYVTVPDGVEVKGMRITTMTGAVQYQARRYEKEVNVSGMSAGFYILHVETNKGLMWSKFSKE